MSPKIKDKKRSETVSYTKGNTTSVSYTNFGIPRSAAMDSLGVKVKHNSAAENGEK